MSPWTLLVAFSVVSPGAAEWEVPMTSPLAMHAAALDRELDGEPHRALLLLRGAQRLAPQESMIAFDLARIALESDSVTLDADVAPFLATEPDSRDARVLRAYILAHQGLRQAASEQLTALLVGTGELGEATRLRELIRQDATAAPTRLLSGSLRLGIEGDSNVTVVPDTPRRQEGLRQATQGSITLVPSRGPSELLANVTLRYAPHLNRREVLSEFDIGSVTALLRGRRSLGATLLTVQLSGNAIVIEKLDRPFMRDLFAELELRRPFDRAHVGLFARGGYRDFGAFNPEADPDDRDGARYSLGGLWDWSAGRLNLGLEGSFEGANTDGRQQREAGTELGAFGGWNALPWQLRMSVNHALRYFASSRLGNDARMDNRVTTSLSLHRVLSAHLGAFAAIMWVKNISSQGFGYDRALLQTGVVSQW